jgi:hypothetical protein
MIHRNVQCHCHEDKISICDRNNFYGDKDEPIKCYHKTCQTDIEGAGVCGGGVDLWLPNYSCDHGIRRGWVDPPHVPALFYSWKSPTTPYTESWVWKVTEKLTFTGIRSPDFLARNEIKIM